MPKNISGRYSALNYDQAFPQSEYNRTCLVSYQERLQKKDKNSGFSVNL